MTAIPKGFTGGLARLRGTEKKIKKALQRALARLCIGQVRPFPDVRIARGPASARTGAYEHEASNHIGWRNAKLSAMYRPLEDPSSSVSVSPSARTKAAVWL